MNTRIRYKETAPGILTSRRLFTTAAGQEVVVQLDLENKQYLVLDSVSKAVVASGGKTRNKSVLKIQSKAALVALGVPFEAEARDRANTALNEASTGG